MTTQRPPGATRSMMALALAVALVVTLLTLASCARPTKTIAFQGESVRGATGLIVHLDLTYTKATEGSAQYPFDTATSKAFIHFQVAEVGTVASYSLKIIPIEPGQKVKCWISINGLIVDQHTATFPKAAVCGGPPV